MGELLEMVPTIVDAIQAQNWKAGGCLKVDRDEAIAAVEQLVRTAYSAGQVSAVDEAGKQMLGIVDAVLGTPARV